MRLLFCKFKLNKSNEVLIISVIIVFFDGGKFIYCMSIKTLNVYLTKTIKFLDTSLGDAGLAREDNFDFMNINSK